VPPGRKTVVSGMGLGGAEVVGVVATGVAIDGAVAACPTDAAGSGVVDAVCISGGVTTLVVVCPMAGMACGSAGLRAIVELPAVTGAVLLG
jgi:hypothetical protein